MINLRDITRIEIIDDTGRTLKIFLDHGGEDECSTVTVLQAVLWQLGRGKEGREAAREMIERHLEQILGGDDD